MPFFLRQLNLRPESSIPYFRLLEAIEEMIPDLKGEMMYPSLQLSEVDPVFL
jgi:hypothetical protein